MKILLSAYACEPHIGSEPEVGWKWATELSKMGNDVYVITRLNNKENIEQELKKKKIKKINFIYFDYPKWFLKIFKGKQNRFSYFYFYIWQIGIYFVAKKIIKKVKFDYIHHVTFVSYRYPSFLCLLDIPFIFGPVSGGEETPKNLRINFDLKSKIKEYLRDISNKIIKFSPIINIVFKKSLKILVTSQETKSKIPKKFHYKTHIELAISPNTGFFYKKKLPSRVGSDYLFKICFAGVFEHRKGIYLILETIKKLKQKNHNFLFNFYGDGPILNFMKKYVINSKLENEVKFHGKISYDKMHSELIKNDIFLFPSLRDSGGFVLFEAMQARLPCVVLNIGGPAKIIDKKCGIKINVGNKDQNQIISEVYKNLADLIKNKNKINHMSRYCLPRLAEFSWKKKIKNIYNL